MKKLNNFNTFLKYIISALMSFIIDIGLFTFTSKLLENIINSYAIIMGTIIARVISSFINYLLNKNKVFEQKNGGILDKSSLFKYYTLVVIQMFVSAFSVWIIHEVINIDATIIKVPVDIVIFIVNYVIQKKFIFKK